MIVHFVCAKGESLYPLKLQMLVQSVAYLLAHLPRQH